MAEGSPTVAVKKVESKRGLQSFAGRYLCGRDYVEVCVWEWEWECVCGLRVRGTHTGLQYARENQPHTYAHA